jgi:hypothetical protein
MRAPIRTLPSYPRLRINVTAPPASPLAAIGASLRSAYAMDRDTRAIDKAPWVAVLLAELDGNAPPGGWRHHA